MTRNSDAQISRRHFVRDSALGLTGAALAAATTRTGLAQAAGGVKQRRNIEDFPELGNYLHALEILKNRPRNHPQSYVSLAQIHNSNSVPCEHNRDMFLPWHRGMLYVFEQALQQADPPRTANVTIPYYDYTKLPAAGVRYPAPFEDSTSILSMIWTAFGWEPSNRNSERITSPFYTDSQMRRLITTNPNWSSSNLGSGGSVNGFGGLVSGGKGALESPSHDDMHSFYIGGQLSRTTSAADDPIFWSFHTFIDLLWYRWQQAYPNSPIGGHDRPLRGMPIPLTVGQVLNVRDLNYDYKDDPPPNPAFAALAISGSFTQQNPHVAAQANKDDVFVLETRDVKIPPPGFHAAPFVISNFQISENINYRGYLYLHPKSVPFEPKSDLFRERYLVDDFSVLSMKAMPGMQNPTTALSFQLGESLARLSDSVAGQEYVLTVAVAAVSADAGRVLSAGLRATVLNASKLRDSIKSGKSTLDFLR